MSDTNNKQQTDFSQDIRELESIVEWFEGEDVDLDQALGKFERGMKLASKLKQHLESVENRVEKIKQKFEGASLEKPKPDAEESEPK